MSSSIVIRNDAGGRQRSRRLRLVLACVGVLALCGLVAATALAQPAPQTTPGDPLDPRTHAPESKLFLAVYATGVQKYACQVNGKWLFTDPEATLYATAGDQKPIGTHFLNFSSGRPVWQFKDGSSVEAARKVTVPAGTGNIASLLLEKAVTTAGADGDRLTGTTWVQRLNTSGGVAPDETCTSGDTIAVPYSADYLFWKATGAGERGA
jgi:Protein of unknown function (DUF3455)